jgi:hypothetical protein
VLIFGTRCVVGQMFELGTDTVGFVLRGGVERMKSAKRRSIFCLIGSKDVEAGREKFVAGCRSNLLEGRANIDQGNNIT